MVTAGGRLLPRLQEPPAFVSGPRKVRVGAIPWPGPVLEQFSWSQAVPRPRHFLPPRSLEARTSLSHPRSPRLCQGPADGGRGAPSGQREEAANSVVLCGAHSSGPAAGRGHVVTRDIPSWPVPRPARAEQASLGKWLQTSDCFLIRTRSLGKTECRGGSSAYDPSSSLRPQVPPPLPSPLPTSQIILGQDDSDGKTLRSLTRQGPHTVHRYMKPNSGEEMAAVTAIT